MIKKIFILSMVLLAVSCKKNVETSVEYRPGVVQKTSKDFYVPRELRSIIEKKYLEFIRKNNTKVVQVTDEEIIAKIPREFLDVNLYFRSSANGVLSDHTEFRTPRGGGLIDLKEYVVGKKGSFYMTAKASRTNTPDAPLQNLQIYFLSQSKPKTIDRDRFGLECGSFFEVTEQLDSVKNSNGLQLNATDGRYVPVLSGVFYFVDFDLDRKIFLSAVKIEGSRYAADACDNLVSF